ncbi:dioxygenase [Acrocarpospora pleiomorpha]|uniref:Dioxygenase n=1 Tax=Acrocarpospora pleiomorpha TaxID=90975 RepID=A0A5M3XNM7_9ACTN|nr:VOC family protein [Acrocarpospora pleiomorpha]GES22814.1 dioxygenase [Acrocarpospora pleiomorpha]
MPLHRLTRITMGVPDVRSTAAYYGDFGLTRVTAAGGTPDVERFSTVDGGEQLAITYAPSRRLLDLGVGVDDSDDLDRVARAMERLEVETVRSATAVEAFDPGTHVRVRVEIAQRVESSPTPAPAYNAPGVIVRENARADAVTRGTRVRPRKLGHVVLGSIDQEATQRFFTEGVGFKVSDTVKDLAAFLRCSTDHHNLLVQRAPVNFLHHTSWQVDDVDEVGRGAAEMLEADPQRHVWGLGRHAIGSNFFWYLKDPAGNFSEYYADIDCIVDDALWTPGVWEGARSLYQWGPPPPPSFLAPEDLAGLMTGSHSS